MLFPSVPWVNIVKLGEKWTKGVSLITFVVRTTWMVMILLLGAKWVRLFLVWTAVKDVWQTVVLLALQSRVKTVLYYAENSRVG